jgi:hypothetical protein
LGFGQCFQQGLKNLRHSSTSSHSRGRSRASSGVAPPPAGQYDDEYDHDPEVSSQGDYESNPADLGVPPAAGSVSSAGRGGYEKYDSSGVHDDSGFDEQLVVGEQMAVVGEPGPSRRTSHAHSLSLPMVGSGYGQVQQGMYRH